MLLAVRSGTAHGIVSASPQSALSASAPVPLQPLDRQVWGPRSVEQPSSGLGGFGDPIGALTINLLGDQVKVELFLDHAGKEAPNRMLLPIRCLHDRRNRGAPGLSQHCEHRLLFCWWPSSPPRGKRQHHVLPLTRPRQSGRRGERGEGTPGCYSRERRSSSDTASCRRPAS